MALTALSSLLSRHFTRLAHIMIKIKGVVELSTHNVLSVAFPRQMLTTSPDPYGLITKTLSDLGFDSSRKISNYYDDKTNSYIYFQTRK
jgi:hypothetical protein